MYFLQVVQGLWRGAKKWTFFGSFLSFIPLQCSLPHLFAVIYLVITSPHSPGMLESNDIHCEAVQIASIPLQLLYYGGWGSLVLFNRMAFYGKGESPCKKIRSASVLPENWLSFDTKVVCILAEYSSAFFQNSTCNGR